MTTVGTVPVPKRVDVAIVGGGHNGLVAAAYLAAAGKSVVVLERLDHVGGAAVSAQAFAGLSARLSRYSYLVSLLPTKIMNDLGLQLDLRSRRVSSFTPVTRQGRATGLYVGRGSHAERERTSQSFGELCGNDREYAAWTNFYERCEHLAKVLAPTLLEPLRSADEHRAALGDDQLWEQLFVRPLGEAIEATFVDDTVRGVVATDGLIGTFADMHDPSLMQNACFAYHVIGDGHGEWKVPVGGMGAVSGALAAAAQQRGAQLVTNATVTAIRSDGSKGEVDVSIGEESTVTIAADWILAGCAPRTLHRLLGGPSPTDEAIEGCQLKMNMLLTRLPTLKSGISPEDAFAGTLHISEDYSQMAVAYQQARAGMVPDELPGEVYCHSLTDPSILGDELAAKGFHTLTLFGLHLPASLFTKLGNDVVKAQAAQRYLAQINEFCTEPIEACMARDANGWLCMEVKSPLDLDDDLDLPGGNIFHRPLAMPFSCDQHEAGSWGVETHIDNVLICGAGAVRGGGVSGIAGHNAAQRVLTGSAQ
jgi:phytoene dehydrogenase-like protein